MWECHTGAAWLLLVDMYAHACARVCVNGHALMHIDMKKPGTHLHAPGLNDW